MKAIMLHPTYNAVTRPQFLLRKENEKKNSLDMGLGLRDSYA